MSLQPQIGRGRGCLANAVGFVALVAVSPFALVIRSLRARRRGRGIRIRRSSIPVQTVSGGSLARIDLQIDLPQSRQAEFVPRITDTVVRVAEALRQPDDVYHLIYREPSAEETVVLPVGPLLQELGERFSLVLAQRSLIGRTAVWIVLPQSRGLAEVVDPFGYDPELAGEPEALIARLGMRWALATSQLGCGASVIHRMVLYLPRGSEDRVNPLLDRLGR